VHRKRGWPGLCPDPAGGAYSTPSNPLAQLRALLLKGREGKEGERRWSGGKGKRMGWK